MRLVRHSVTKFTWHLGVCLIFHCSTPPQCSNYIVLDRHIYLNLSESTQSTAGLKALKPAANGRYLMCKSSPCYLHLVYRSTFILLSVKLKVHAGSFCVSVIHQILTWTTGSVTCIRDHSCA